MHIWVDADACPVVVKDILFKAAERLQVHMTLVANCHVRVPASQIIRSVQVPSGFDVPDNCIELRETGQVQSFTAGYSAKDKVAFANQLDKFLMRHVKR